MSEFFLKIVNMSISASWLVLAVLLLLASCAASLTPLATSKSPPASSPESTPPASTTPPPQTSIPDGLTEDEQIVAYTMRAFLNSPIQISSTLEAVDEFELSLYCNEEIIAINQD